MSTLKNESAAHENDPASRQAEAKHIVQNNNKDESSGQEAFSEYIRKMDIKVFLLDDEYLICEAMRVKLLSEKDIHFYALQDPEQALKAIKDFQPTVILQDLVMPQVNGLQMLKKFKSVKELSDIPLIVLSAREEPELKTRALSLGADDYMIKLPEKQDLITKIRVHSKCYIYKKQRDDLLLKVQQCLNFK